jgi:hypothetical protein
MLQPCVDDFDQLAVVMFGSGHHCRRIRARRQRDVWPIVDIDADSPAAAACRVNVGMLSTTLDDALGFVLTDACSGNALAPSGSCVITVKSEKRNGRKVTQTLTITDSACNSPQTVGVTRR